MKSIKRHCYQATLQKNSTFHTINQTYMFGKIHNINARQFLPPINRVGFLVEIRLCIEKYNADRSIGLLILGSDKKL